MENGTQQADGSLGGVSKRSRSGGAKALGCLVMIGVPGIPIAMMTMSPAEGAMGWNGVMLLPFALIIGVGLGLVIMFGGGKGKS